MKITYNKNIESLYGLRGRFLKIRDVGIDFEPCGDEYLFRPFRLGSCFLFRSWLRKLVPRALNCFLQTGYISKRARRWMKGTLVMR